MNETLTAHSQDRHDLFRWLFNPFYYVAGGKALTAGIGLILATGALSYTGGVRFDGVLDVHTASSGNIPAWVYLADGLLAWIIMSVLLLPGGKVISTSRVRAIDIFGTQALARWPALAMALLVQIPVVQSCLPLLYAKFAGARVSTAELMISLASYLIIALLIIWMVALMYRAFTVSSNVKGAKATLTFIGVILAGEILSKVVLFYIVP